MWPNRITMNPCGSGCANARRNDDASGIDGCWCCYAARAGATTTNACYASIRRNTYR